MDYLKLGYLFCMFWCQIQTVPITAHDCPNNFSYRFGDKCYSPHFDIIFQYAEAVDFCKHYNGVLWSKTDQEEVQFLRKVQEFKSFYYWIGAHKKGGNWKYFSDQSFVSQSFIKSSKSHKDTECLTIQPLIHGPEQTTQKFKTISCIHELYTVCEHTGETCENMKGVGKDCYTITNTAENFTSAAQTCEKLHGRILEIRNDSQISKLKEVLRKDKRVMNPASEKVEKLDGSGLQILWQFKPQLTSEELCEIYENSEIKTENCSGVHYFACKFDAIPSVNVTSKQSNSRDTSTTLEQSSSILQTEHGRIAVTALSESTISSTSTSEETESFQEVTESESSIHNKSTTEALQSTRITQENEQITELVDHIARTTANTNWNKSSPKHETNVSGEITPSTVNGDISPPTIPLLIISATIVTTVIIIGIIVIIIGIIVIIILQLRLMGKKEGKGKAENVYLEPMTSASQPRSPVRRNLPIAPTGTNIVQNWDYTEINDNECEP